jgi:uncharacterized protein (DUF4415 family)
MNENDIKTSSRTDWDRLETMADEEIDYSDIPPLGEEFFQRAKLYTPGAHTVILDDDVFAWLQHQNKDYHALVNQILRQHIERQYATST